MDRIDEYRQIARDVIQKYAQDTSHGSSADLIKTETIADDEQGHYMLLSIGWEGDYRVHHPIIHIDVIGDKVWLQKDNTNALIADELLEAGIPAESIVLGFRHPRVRTHTDFAVA